MAIGTFGSFTQARLAIYAAQTGLSITGNNISNINTLGYTRQRLDQTSLHVGGSDRYANAADVRTGQGVLCTGVSQLRDPYLDIRFRSSNADVGYMDAKLSGLQQIASILDEVGKGEQTEGDDFGILGAGLEEIRKALGNLTTETGHAEFDRQVKAAVEKVVGRFNDYAAKLEQLYNNTVTGLEKKVEKVNGLLTGIRELNEEIRKCDSHDDNALELRDQRNVLIDELSGYIKIDVTYSMEEICPGQEVEKITIKLDDANPDPTSVTDTATLIDGVYAAQISIDQVAQKRELDPKDTTTWPYLGADGKPAMFPEDAAEARIPNPNFDAAQDPSDTNPRYLMADGTPTNDPAQAAPARTLNPKADLTRPNAVGNEWYLDADGAVTTDPNLSQISYEANPDYKPYLNGKGQPTADESEAKLVNNPNFNMTVSELRDRKGYLHYITEKQTPIELRKDGDAAAYQEAIDNLGKTIKNRDPDTGNMHIVSYRESGKDENGDPIYTKYEYVQVLSTPVHLDDNDLHGALQADRELLTEKGEFMDTSIIDGTNEDALSCDEKARSKRGIPYFQKSLDLLANQLANAINGANQGYRYDDQGNYIGLVMGEDGEPMVDEDTGRVIGMPVSIPYQKLDENGAPMVDDDGNAVMGEYKLNKDTKWDKPEVWDALPKEVKTALEATGKTGTEAVKAYLSQPQTHQVQKTDQAGKPMFDQNGNPIMEEVPYTDEDGNPITMGIFEGAVLLSNHNNGDDTTNITARNISISNSWSNNAVSVIRSFQCGPGESEPASGDSKNVLHMQNLFHTKMDYVPSDLFSTRDATGDSMFNGTFSEMWENMGGILGNDQDVTNNSLTTSYKTTLQIDTNRDSVSSVDFNDEAMNLMMYAKSLNAACRLMTTIDTVLDKLINNTGVTT